MATAVKHTSTRPKAAGAPRVPLDRERIIAVGLELAAEPGSLSISVRELGARLGTDPTAIYRHFRNKEQLMQALLDEVIMRSVIDVIADPSEWQERLRQLAAATLHHFVLYPAIAIEATVLTTQGPGELAAVELMLDAFSRAGLDEDEMVHQYALMASLVLSTAAGIARARGERAPGSDEKSPWIDGPLLADPRKYPLIAALAGKLADLEDHSLFTFGVDALIESAERRAAAQH
ncbi:TetR/AcrR family transcriptional regulator [Microterricola viridarii]|uniref:TetR family transcriptional regulator n=1 Tax=Microterricola viridarii TaxID=412690 RepID=A0A109QXZ0_9MICO|nr:TetR/AcrR family transcriptional regulator [Microterricola viridarii]AMB59073.1 TetR family transcriptional regulator [Microterricola viridarii]